MDSRKVSRQHETLRVPQGWNGQDRGLVIQLERILDDIYNQLMRRVISVLGVKADDKGNVVLTKDDITALGFIADNLTTESSTLALSAKQGKILNDALTVEVVDSPITWDADYVVPGSCDCILYKIGNIRIMRVAIYVKDNISTTTVLGVVAQGHRPPDDLWVVVSTSGTNPESKVLSLLDNGNLRTIKMDASTNVSTMYYGEIIYTVQGEEE